MMKKRLEIIFFKYHRNKFSRENQEMAKKEIEAAVEEVWAEANIKSMRKKVKFDRLVQESWYYWESLIGAAHSNHDPK